MIILVILIVYNSTLPTNSEKFVQQSSQQDYSALTQYDPKILLSIHDSNSIKENSQKWNDVSNHQDKAFFQTHKYQDIIDRDFTFTQVPTFQDIQSGSYNLTGIKLLNTSISGPQCDELSLDLFNQFSLSFSLTLQSFTDVNYNFLEIYGNTKNGLLFGFGLKGQQVTITFGNNKPLIFDKSQLKVGVFQVLSFVFDATQKVVYLYINDTQISKQTYDLTQMSIDQDLLKNKSIEIFSNRQIEINPSQKLNILIDTFILLNKTIDPAIVYQLIEKQQIQYSVSSKTTTPTSTTTTTTTATATDTSSICPFNQTDSSLLPCKSKACSSVNWSKNGFLIDSTMPVECVKNIYSYCTDPSVTDPACKCLKVENINSAQCKNQKDLYTYIVNYDKIANQTRPVNFSNNKILLNQCDKNPLDRLCVGLKNQQSTTAKTATTPATTVTTPATAVTTPVVQTPSTSQTTTNTPSTTATTTTTTPTTSTIATTTPTTTKTTAPTPKAASSDIKKRKCEDVKSDNSRLIQLPNTQKLNQYLST